MNPVYMTDNSLTRVTEHILQKPCFELNTIFLCQHGGKTIDDKGYSFMIEIIPIDKFYEFFGSVADSFLLAIFGRLQALDIVKL
ncbi:MAG: hypothetical protein WAV41_05815 [Microgenomates group bacterium]